MRGAAPLAVALLVLAPGCASVRAPSGADAAHPETLAFELRDTRGAWVRTADFAGRVLLVDVWATWCAPCERSMPFYASLQERLGPRGLQVLAVSVDERDADVAAFLERHPLPFPVLRDPSGQVPERLGASMETMPTAVIVGADGRVRAVHAGFVDGDRPRLEAELERALLAAQPAGVVGGPGASP